MHQTTDITHCDGLGKEKQHLLSENCTKHTKTPNNMAFHFQYNSWEKSRSQNAYMSIKFFILLQTNNHPSVFANRMILFQSLSHFKLFFSLLRGGNPSIFYSKTKQFRSISYISQPPYRELENWRIRSVETTPCGEAPIPQTFCGANFQESIAKDNTYALA